MFSLGWPELMLVAFVLVIVVGPKQMPAMLRTISGALGKARRMAQEFRHSMMEAAEAEGLGEVRSAISDAKGIMDGKIMEAGMLDDPGAVADDDGGNNIGTPVMHKKAKAGKKALPRRAQMKTQAKAKAKAKKAKTKPEAKARKKAKRGGRHDKHGT